MPTPILSIIMPALNEEKNIAAAIEKVVLTFDKLRIAGEIVVVNDGSTDATPELARQKAEKHPEQVRILNHSTPQGIGASFWDGVDTARGEIVCMLPGDNENEPAETLRYLKLMDDVDIVVPFVVNTQVRSGFRKLLSFLYRAIINTTFRTSFNYTNGTVLYRKSLLTQLPKRNKGFFYQTDILVRLAKQGHLFAEVPYKLRERTGGQSKAVSLQSLRKVIKGYLALVKDIYFTKGKAAAAFPADSATARRK